MRKQGDRVRIVAELIDAQDGSELWSRTFDRELKDIFVVQVEIAEAVATSLELTLLGTGERSAKNASTKSVEAHNAYLQGHFYFERGNLQDYHLSLFGMSNVRNGLACNGIANRLPRSRSQLA